MLKFKLVHSSTKTYKNYKFINNFYFILILIISSINQINAQTGGECRGCPRGTDYLDDLLQIESRVNTLWTELANGNIGYVFPGSENKKVGIGTAYPQFTLDVNGVFRSKGIQVDGNLTSSANIIVGRNALIKGELVAQGSIIATNGLYVSGTTNFNSESSFDKTVTVKKDLTVEGALNTSELYINGKLINENSNSPWQLLRDGDIGFIFPEGNDNRVGIGNDNPTHTLDVNGSVHTEGDLILSGTRNYGIYSTPTTGRGNIIIPGPTSQYLIGVQDGNGRVQHKWNATSGTNETFLVGNENASFMNWNGGVNSNRWFEFKFADGLGKSAGERIDWQTHFSIEKNGNIGVGMTTAPTEKLEVNGNLKTTKLLANAIDVTSDSRFRQDVYVDGVISVDEAIYAPSGKFENLVIGKTILPDGGIASSLKDPANRIVIFSGNGEEANVSFAPDRTTLYKNVGINKIPNPNYDLDVKGSINASGILINGESITSTWNKTPNTTSDLFYDLGNVSIGNSEIEGGDFNLKVAGNVTGQFGDFQNLKIQNKVINFDGYADKTSQQVFQAFTLSALAAIGVSEAWDKLGGQATDLASEFAGTVIDAAGKVVPRNAKCNDCVKKGKNATLRNITANGELTVNDRLVAKNITANGVLTVNDRLVAKKNAAIEGELRVSQVINTPKLLVAPGNSPEWKTEWNDKINGDGSGYEMVVEGDFIAQRIAVASNFETFQWPDYVFKSDYELQPLEAVETFIKKESHLPNVPSEKEVKEEGLDLAEINAILLRKIEELTLYAIDQNKRINKLEASLQKN